MFALIQKCQNRGLVFNLSQQVSASCFQLKFLRPAPILPTFLQLGLTLSVTFFTILTIKLIFDHYFKIKNQWNRRLYQPTKVKAEVAKDLIKKKGKQSPKNVRQNLKHCSIHLPLKPLVY